MSTLRVNTVQNTSGVEQYLAKAWVRFIGTGTVAISAAGNVSSITDNGVGDYTVNFTNAMADANYAPTAWCQGPAGNAHNNWIAGTKGTGSLTTTACNITVTNAGSVNLADVDRVGVAIFR